MTTDYPYLAFLSYASADVEVVLSASEGMSREGLSTFVAKQNTPHGAQWRDEILDALKRCDVLVAFVSKSFRASEWTDQEVGYALGRGKNAVPVRVSAGVTPHGFLSPSQAPDVGGMRSSGIAAVIIDALLAYPEERERLADFVVASLETDRRRQALKTSIQRLSRYPSVSPRHLKRVRDAAKANSLLRRDTTLRDAMEKLLTGWMPR